MHKVSQHFTRLQANAQVSVITNSYSQIGFSTLARDTWFATHFAEDITQLTMKYLIHYYIIIVVLFFFKLKYTLKHNLNSISSAFGFQKHIN